MVAKLSTLFLTALLALFTLAASGGEMEFQAEVGYDGYYRPGEWNPVQASAKDEGPARRGQAVIEVSQSGWPSATYRMRVGILPEPGTFRAQVRMPAYPMRDLKASLVSEGRTVVGTRIGPLFAIEETAPLAVTSSLSLGFLQDKKLGVCHTPAGLYLSSGPAPSRLWEEDYEDSGG